MNSLKYKIIELRKKGISLKEISAKLNCAKSTVSYHINSEGLGGQINPLKFIISDNDKNLIIKYRNINKSYNEINKLTNISYDKIKYVCKEENLNKQSNIFKNKVIDFTENDIITKYKELKSLRDTALYFNISRYIIRKYIPDNIVLENSIRVINKTKSQAVIDWRVRKKIELVEYKGGCCEKCGYNKSIGALQFHHIDPRIKDFQISGKSYSFERLKKEVDKCIMVCANCHIEIHEELRKSK